MLLPAAAAFQQAARGTSLSQTRRLRSPHFATSPSQLEQLAGMTTISIDSGDLDAIEHFSKTGFITDATTNPLFVAQVGLSGHSTYQLLVEESVLHAKENGGGVDLAMDALAVNLGERISKLVDGYVSTEVDPRLSFDEEATVAKGRKIIELYESKGVDRSRILVKIAATWEGIQAAARLEKENIACNLTLVFSEIQGIACAQHGATLISPFPGRLLDWHNAKDGRLSGVDDPLEDEGVQCVTRLHKYFRLHNHRNTILMPASWRPSRKTGDPNNELDEILALAGVDRMTIPVPLLTMLLESNDKVERKLFDNNIEVLEEIGGGRVDEKTFRLMLNEDACGTEKLAEGLRSFIALTNELEGAMSKFF